MLTVVTATYTNMLIADAATHTQHTNAHCSHCHTHMVTAVTAAYTNVLITDAATYTHTHTHTYTHTHTCSL